MRKLPERRVSSLHPQLGSSSILPTLPNVRGGNGLENIALSASFRGSLLKSHPILLNSFSLIAVVTSSIEELATVQNSSCEIRRAPVVSPVLSPVWIKEVVLALLMQLSLLMFHN